MTLLLIALIIDRVVGDPDWLWQRVPHPVVGFGRIISRVDDALGDDRADQARAFSYGVAVLALLFLVCMAVWWLVVSLGAWLWPAAWLLELIIVVVMLAQKSLHDHVAAVAHALRSDGLDSGRAAVSRIVGRNVSSLDESGVSKAAIESLAENYSDGVVAPVFWYCVAGLPGILFYKAVNTADSMIGHKSPKYLHFGRAAAILDDWMNWPAARISAVLISLAHALKAGGARAWAAFENVREEAPLHVSPNAGWPEAAFAHALGLSLGGPRSYGGEAIEAVTFNSGGRERAGVPDISTGLALFERTGLILWGVVLFLAVIF
ncbi:MAG: adenosylcobinamide-phosphate synthase CbiB [Pseudomonadota bacterium]